MVGTEARRIVAAVQDMERACQIEAEKQRSSEAVHRVATVGNSDPPVAPPVTATLPLPTARRRVNSPPRKHAFTESRIVR